MNREQFKELTQDVFEVIQNELSLGDNLSLHSTVAANRGSFRVWLVPGERLNLYKYTLVLGDDSLAFEESYGTDKHHYKGGGELPAGPDPEAIADHFFERL